jgi:hypothetical protein
MMHTLDVEKGPGKAIQIQIVNPQIVGPEQIVNKIRKE